MAPQPPWCPAGGDRLPTPPSLERTSWPAGLQRGSLLGQGATAAVHLGRFRGKSVAIKEAREEIGLQHQGPVERRLQVAGASFRESAEREAECLGELMHPNITQLHCAFRDPMNIIVLVVDFAGTPLDGANPRPPIMEAWGFAEYRMAPNKMCHADLGTYWTLRSVAPSRSSAVVPVCACVCAVQADLGTYWTSQSVAPSRSSAVVRVVCVCSPSGSRDLLDLPVRGSIPL